MVSVLALRSVAACALPRPSAIASAKLAKSTVNQSQNATWPVKSGCPRPAGELLHPDDRREQAADLDDEHHRVLDLNPRIQLSERVGNRRLDDARIPNRNLACAFCHCRVLSPAEAGHYLPFVSFVDAGAGAPNISSRARFSSSTLTRARPRKPNVGVSVCEAISSRTRLASTFRAACHACGLQLCRVRRNVRVQPAAAGGHHLGGHLIRRHALLLRDGVEPLLHGLEVVGVRRPVVGATGRRRVVVDSRRPRLEVLRPRELLRDQPRARRSCRRRVGSDCLRSASGTPLWPIAQSMTL